MWWFTPEALGNGERERFQAALKEARDAAEALKWEEWATRFAELYASQDKDEPIGGRANSEVRQWLMQAIGDPVQRIAEQSLKDISNSGNTNKLFDDPAYKTAFEYIVASFMKISDASLMELKTIIAKKIGYGWNPSELRVSVVDGALVCQGVTLKNTGVAPSIESRERTPLSELPRDVVDKLETMWLKHAGGMRMLTPEGKWMNFWLNNNTYTIDITYVDIGNRDSEKWYEVVLNKSVPWQKVTTLRFMESWSKGRFGVIVEPSGETKKIY